MTVCHDCRMIPEAGETKQARTRVDNEEQAKHSAPSITEWTLLEMMIEEHTWNSSRLKIELLNSSRYLLSCLEPLALCGAHNLSD